MLTFSFRLPPGPETVRYARLAEEIGYEGIWIPEVPAFGHDIWISLARVAEATSHIRFGPAVLIPSYRHPLAQASAIATLEALAPGRLRVGFGTGFHRTLRPWQAAPNAALRVATHRAGPWAAAGRGRGHRS